MHDCTDKNIGRLIHLYELNLLEDEEKEKFEVHLYECEFCFESIQSFQAASTLLNSDPDVIKVVNAATEDQPRSDEEEGPIRAKRRPLIPAIIFAALVLVLLIARPWQIEFRPSKEAFARQNRLAILYFEDETAEGDTTRMCEIAASLLITDLSESDYLQVVSSQRIFDILKQLGTDKVCAIGKDIAFEVAKIADARWMLTGNISSDSGRITLMTQLIDVNTKEVRASQVASGSEENGVFPLIDSLSIKIKNDLALPEDAFYQDRPIAQVTTSSREAYQAYLEGLEFQARYENVQAVAAFQRAIEIDSTFAMAYYHLAFLNNGAMINKAAEYSSHASNKEQLYIQSAVALKERNSDLFRQNILEIIQKYPDEKDAIYLMGRFYFNRQVYDSALVYFRRAIEIDPLFKQALNNIAYTYNRLGDHEQAVLAINRYIDVAPNEANPYDTRGEIYTSAGLLEKAKESFRKALEIQPDFHSSRYQLGINSIFTHDYDSADYHFRTLLELPDTRYQESALIALSYVPMHRGHFKEALRRLDEAIAFDIEHSGDQQKTGSIASFHIIKSMLYLELNQYELAETAIRIGVDILNKKEGFLPQRYNEILVHILALEGKFAEAEALAEELDSIFAGTPQNYRYWYAAGAIEFAKGNFDSAVVILRKADSGNHSFYTDFLLAKAYLKAGMLAEAVEELEDQLNTYTESRLYVGLMNIKMHYYLGLAYERSNWVDKAIEQYKIFVDTWKEAGMPVEELNDARKRLARLTESR